MEIQHIAVVEPAAHNTLSRRDLLRRVSIGLFAFGPVLAGFLTGAQTAHAVEVCRIGSCTRLNECWVVCPYVCFDCGGGICWITQYGDVYVNLCC